MLAPVCESPGRETARERHLGQGEAEATQRNPGAPQEWYMDFSLEDLFII